MIVDPFLGLLRNIYWTDGMPTVADAAFAVMWALEHAIDVNAGGIKGPARIATLQKGEGGKWVAVRYSDEQLDEHRQMVKGAHEHMRGFPGTKAGAPSLPTPPP